jgi:hypothetical protein
MMKADRAFCQMQGNRREHMPSGIYIEISNAPSNAKLLVSDELGTDMGFNLHRKEVTMESNVSTYRLIGYYAHTKYVKPEDVIKYNFRIATEEESKIINHNACLT